MEEGEAGLGVPSVLVGSDEGLLGPTEVAPSQPDRAELEVSGQPNSRRIQGRNSSQA